MTSTPSNWPAVPAHVCACPLHDLVSHTRAVELHIRRHDDNVVVDDGHAAGGITPATEGGARERVRTAVATAHGGGQECHGTLDLWDTSDQSTCKHLDEVGCPHITVRLAPPTEGCGNRGRSRPAQRVARRR